MITKEKPPIPINYAAGDQLVLCPRCHRVPATCWCRLHVDQHGHIVAAPPVFGFAGSDKGMTKRQQKSLVGYLQRFPGCTLISTGRTKAELEAICIADMMAVPREETNRLTTMAKVATVVLIAPRGAYKATTHCDQAGAYARARSKSVVRLFE